MSTKRLTNEQGHSLAASVVLICTACQHTWEPDLLDPTDRSEAASTGCPLCGGWTWIGQISEPGDGRGSARNSTNSQEHTR